MASKRKRQIKKSTHDFVLAGSKATYYSGITQASFPASTLPTFNRDGLYYTPCFIIPSLYEPKNAAYLLSHKTKMENNTEISME